MNKKAVIVTWDGFQDQEVIYPYYRLREYGFDVTITGANGKSEVVGLFGTKFKSMSPQDMGSPDDWDMLVLPGGVKALEKVRQDPTVLQFIKNWPDNKVISSICHGAQLLISCGKTKGQTVSGYYSIEDDIVNSGGTYSALPVVSANIASGAHYNDMPVWMKQTLELYERLQ
ncbi:DJ-1/PfpI family protein [Marinobacter sp.]|uniref:DJ-1/PfpI family protein n=1 Tax=Marinobacter sp. TaxID=50741 RepID=UPI0023521865|nr:DJ-1/PfpI family protein [Marinobacter sp.]